MHEKHPPFSGRATKKQDMSHLIRKHPILEVPEGKTVSFTFDGRTLTGREGQPIAGALLDNGISVFRRTPKHGQPRSLFCGIGQCNDCVVIVNGCPNVRSCITPLSAGMDIRTQQGLGRVADV